MQRPPCLCNSSPLARSYSVRDHVKKGTQLFIEGKIQIRSWDFNAVIVLANC